MADEEEKHPLEGLFGGLLGNAEKGMKTRTDKIDKAVARQTSGEKVRDTSKDKPPKGFKQVK